MAKIVDLEIDTIKIKSTAITDFASPDPLSGNTLISVDNPFQFPVLIWFGADGAGSAANLVRTWDSVILATCGEYGRKVAMDATPNLSELYQADGVGAVVFGAMVVFR